MDLPFLFFMIANLLLVTTCVVMAGVRFFTLRNYSKAEQEYYFPDGRLICVFLFSSLFELPYLFSVRSESALLYVVLFDFLLFTPQAILLWEKKFYHTKITLRLVLKHLLLPVFILIPLFVGALTDYAWTSLQRNIFIGLSGAAFFLGLYRLYATVVTKYRAVAPDLERGFVLATYMILSLRMVFIVSEFTLLNHWAKMICDLVYSVFTFYTILKNVAIIRPPLKGAIAANTATDITEMFDLTEHKMPLPEKPSEKEEKISELGLMIRDVIIEKELFRQSDLKLTSLCQYLPTNRTYLSAEINKMDPKGFYSFILGFRIDYACKLMMANPEIKIEEVALQSGFSSQKIFSRLFRQEMGMSPSVYRGLQTTRPESLNVF